MSGPHNKDARGRRIFKPNADGRWPCLSCIGSGEESPRRVLSEWIAAHHDGTLMTTKEYASCPRCEGSGWDRE